MDELDDILTTEHCRNIFGTLEVFMEYMYQNLKDYAENLGVRVNLTETLNVYERYIFLINVIQMYIPGKEVK